jgi:hypothetical protein
MPRILPNYLIACNIARCRAILPSSLSLIDVARKLHRLVANIFNNKFDTFYFTTAEMDLACNELGNFSCFSVNVLKRCS